MKHTLTIAVACLCLAVGLSLDAVHNIMREPVNLDSVYGVNIRGNTIVNEGCRAIVVVAVNPGLKSLR